MLALNNKEQAVYGNELKISLRTGFRLMSLLVFLGVFASMPCGAQEFQAETFPDNPLPVSDLDDEHLAYLGIDSKVQSFSAADIDADIVVVQVFSMYCPICQREAEAVNRMYHLKESRELDMVVRMIGIAPGNSAFEVGVFRDEYAISFPLFPDPDYQWHKILGEVGTPYFIVFSGRDAGVKWTHKGAFADPESFLDRVMHK